MNHTTREQFPFSTALVLGSAKGIGASLARGLQNSGVRTFTVDKLGSSDAKFHFSADLDRDSDRSELVSWLRSQIPSIDRVFFCIGNYSTNDLFTCSKEELKRTLDENLVTPASLTRALLPLLRQESHLVYLTSSLGKVIEPQAIAYGSAKSALDSFIQASALSLAPLGIASYGVACGPVQDTTSHEESCGGDADYYSSFHPAQAFLMPQQVADFLLGLSKNEAGSVSGSIYPFNGGEFAVGAAWSTLQNVRENGRVNSDPSLQSLLPSERVRLSCSRIVSDFQLIELNESAMQDFADRIQLSDLEQHGAWEAPFHLAQEHPEILNYVFTVDAVNFGCGFSPDWKAQRNASTYATVAGALKTLAESGASLGPEFAMTCTPDQVGELIKMPSSFALSQRFSFALNELGAFVLSKYGSYESLLESLSEESRGQQLIQLITKNCACFDDAAILNGRAVYFYKRAQILVNDIFLSHIGRPTTWMTEDDVSALTIFADNLIPHVLKREGILVLDDDFDRQIGQQRKITSSSRAEIELRAAGVAACEMLTEKLRDREVECTPAQLDVYLWNIGQQEKYKQYPRHLTECFYY